jgi:hypothetical protein
MQHELGASLAGKWRVRREAGLLPPFGISKRIGADSGWTCLAGVPLLPFRVVWRDGGAEFRYRVLPIVDEVVARPDGTWNGVARFAGWKFCDFSLLPKS